MRGRATLVVLHRWAGLTIAGFLLVAGVTGATLPFREELTWLCAPALWRAAPPAAGARPLPGPELAERVAAQTGGQPVQVPLRIDGDHAIAMFVFARPGARPLGYDRVIVDPYSGQVRERLRFGAIEAFPRDLPTFLLALHYGYIAGKAGQLVFGLAAMIWLLDGLVGVALTFPIRMRSRKLETHRYGLLAADRDGRRVLLEAVSPNDRRSFEFDGAARVEILKILTSARSRLPRDVDIDPNALATPGSACPGCRFRPECRAYGTWAQRAWRDPGFVAPLDSWGEIQRVHLRDDLADIVIAAPDGALTRVVGFPYGQLEGPPRVSERIHLFDLVSAEIAPRTRPANMLIVDHRHPANSAWSAAIERRELYRNGS